MKDDEFLQLLKQIEKYGLMFSNFNFESNKSIPKNYKLIIDTLKAVCKIGNGNLESGLNRLTEEYSENVNAITHHGWGKKDPYRAKTPMGKQRAIVELIKSERPKYISQEETCEAFGIKYKSEFRKYDPLIKEHEKKLHKKFT